MEWQRCDNGVEYTSDMRKPCTQTLYGGTGYTYCTLGAVFSTKYARGEVAVATVADYEYNHSVGC